MIAGAPQNLRVVDVNVLEDHAVDRRAVYTRLIVNGLVYISSDQASAFSCDDGRVRWNSRNAGYNLEPGDLVWLESIIQPEEEPPSIAPPATHPVGPARRRAAGLVALYLTASVLGAQSLHYRRVACGWPALNYAEYLVVGLAWPCLPVLYAIISIGGDSKECP